MLKVKNYYNECSNGKVLYNFLRDPAYVARCRQQIEKMSVIIIKTELCY
jgi:hypothetical protein